MTIDISSCIFCSGELRSLDPCFKPIHQQYPSSISTSQALTVLNSHYFQPSVCAQCGLPQFSTNTVHQVLGYFDSTSKFNEPSDHFDHITDYLIPEFSQNEFSIIAFSSKDEDLYAHLSSMLPSRAVDCNNTLFLCSRFLEHISSNCLLSKLFDRIHLGDHIYIELLDFANQDSPLFLWDERITYPTSDYLIAFFNSLGFELKFEKHFSFTESFCSLIFQKTNNYTLPFNYSRLSHLNLLLHFNHMLDIVRNQLLPANSIAFYGTGHKSLTIAGMLLSLNPEVELLLFDGSPSKIGRFWYRHLIQSFDSDNPPSSQIHLISFGGLGFDMIKSTVLSHSPKSKVISLHELFKYNSSF